MKKDKFTLFERILFQIHKNYCVGLVGLPFIFIENKFKLTNFTKVCEDLHEGGVTVI